MTIQDLPALNATLNGVAAICLYLGWCAIKSGKKDLHAKWMVGALVASTAFLTSYLIYHFNVQAVTTYPGEGFWKWVYYFILATHVPLATLMLPFVIYAVWMAIRKNFEKHKRVTRWLWPVWMYVSVTGVIIYMMLYIDF